MYYSQFINSEGSPNQTEDTSQSQPLRPDTSEIVPLTSHHGSSDCKFQSSPPFRDVIFAVIFYAHIFALLILGGATPSSPSLIDDNIVPQAGNTSDFRRFFLLVLLTAVIGGGCAFGWLSIVRRFARQLIVASLCASVCVWGLLAVFMLARGQVVVGVCLLIPAGWHLLLYVWWRPRIPFAVAMLETVAQLVERFPATAYVAYGSLLVQLGWVAAWIWLLCRVQFYESTAQAALVVLLLLSFYWTSQVIKNTVHVTASGVFASWYFLDAQPDANGHGALLLPRNPTLRSLKRATTTSFGSVCVGSLLVALLHTLRLCARALRNRASHHNAAMRFVACVAECLLGVLQRLMQYFNVYAFSQVAIYGKSYLQAARDTYRLLSSHGIEALINDSLLSSALMVGTLLGGVCGALAACLLAQLLLLPAYCLLPSAFVGFVICFAMVSQTTELIESGVATIFVCFAMEPEVLKRNSPHLFQLFASTFAQH
eukprot:TRINITY_DN3113_c0_g1_i2.p1 TRINITY_DN3113_c0_g1~~TRINITY_DN3113_c0_g1_i2.p1  ORF type:complete len:484 (+),score=153.58 TRINITY_DN3113_c0_g1_i2:1195-2646(+)